MGALACKQKIIQNGGTIADELNRICYQIQEPEFVLFTDPQGYEMVRLLNDAEDLVFQFKRVFLESQGFDGPWPHSLESKSGKP